MYVFNLLKYKKYNILVREKYRGKLWRKEKRF